MVCRTEWVGLLVTAALAAMLPSRAQESVGTVWTPPQRAPAALASLDGNGTVVSPSGVEPRVEDVVPDTPPQSTGLDFRGLDVKLELPTYRCLPPGRQDFVHQVSLTRLPVGSLIVRYEGLEGLVMRKLQGRLRAEWRNSLRRAYDGEVLDYDGYLDGLQQMGESIGDMRSGGRWWERSWMDSLPAHRGGAPAERYVHTYGETLEIFSLGPLSFTNDLRGRVDKVTILSLDPDSGQIYRDLDVRHLAREDAYLERADAGDENLPVLTPDRDAQATDEPLVRLTLEPPAPELLPSWWKLRFRPGANMGVTKGIDRLLREVSMEVSLELYLGAEADLKFMEIKANATYDVEDNIGVLAFQVQLLTW